MDFSIKTYKVLLSCLINNKYSFLRFKDYLESYDLSKRFVIIRHDVDARPENSLRFARIQKDMGIRGSYYFRTDTESWDEDIIREIADMGHEVGYHYEDFDMVHKVNKRIEETESYESAIKSFAHNLKRLRAIVPVSTMCMHGSPRSKYDNRDLWNVYNYHDFGIIGEPYFDIDFSKVACLTDTGRRWDGDKVSIRDKYPIEDKNGKDIVSGGKNDKEPSILPVKYHSTWDIINALNNGTFPYNSMLTFHPQRWTDDLIPWVKELAWQNVKNVIKYFLIKSF